jgi:hypothetical protein
MRQSALRDYQRCGSEMQLKVTEKYQTPSICVGLKRDDPVLCWNDKEKLWDGTYVLHLGNPNQFFVRSKRGEVRPMKNTAVIKYEEGIQVKQLLPPPDASSDEPRIRGENDIRLPEYSDELGLPFPIRRSLSED